MKKTLVGLIVLAGILQAQAIRGNSGFSTSKLKNDDDNFESTSIGFPINFFGQRYTSTYVTNNGNITLGSINTVGGRAEWVPTSIRNISTPIIAPFYADVDTTNSSAVSFGNDTVNGHKAFAVNYVGVGYFNAKADKLNSFQLVLIERSDTGAGNFDIEFNYGSIQWDIGENTTSGRAYASVGYTNALGGAQNASFELPGSLTAGAFLDNGPYALIRQSRNSNGVPGRLVFEVRNGDVGNTTLILQPDKTILNCPDATLIARGSGFGGTNIFTVPAFHYNLKENGVAREITEAFATKVSDAPPGTYDFTVKYRTITPVDSTGAQTSNKIDLTITLPAAASDPAYTATDSKSIRNCGVAADCGTLPKTGRIGFSLSGRASASGGLPPYVYTAPNGVPPGLTFARDGALSGAPSSAGNFSYVVRVDDNSQTPQFSLVTCALAISGTNAPLAGSCNTPGGVPGASYSGSIVGSGGAGGYTYRLTNGSLAPGLSLNSSTGAITGIITATASGNYAFTVTVTDSAGGTVAVPCSVQVTPVVIPIPSITSFAPPAVVVGSDTFSLTVTGTNFNSGSVVVWDGFALPTHFTNATTLVASIATNLTSWAHAVKLHVKNGSTVGPDQDYEVVNPLSVTSTIPRALTTSTAPIVISITGDGFYPNIALSINGVSAPVTRLSAQQLQTQIPASLLAQPGTITLRLDNPNGLGVSVPLQVVSSVTVTPSVSIDKPAVITDQSIAIVKLTQAPGQMLNGTLTISFSPGADNNPNNGPTDFPRFTTASTRQIAFTIAATGTEFRAPIDQGSVAGVATVKLSSLTANGVDLLNGASITQTLNIDPAVPFILPASVGMVRTANGFNVEVSAISTLRSLTGATLSFTLASGVANNGAASFPVDNLANLANTWFQSDAGKTAGGSFKLTIPFTFEGDFSNITGVQVILSNSRGASAAVSGGRR
ncbi:nidogen-like domain-containing protein [Bryobacter aggregatus]|uniref:nidogen-like domain-containing protein n=1 Tax=Bryobacter aggregatus TaxID=360054 RepID=UPI00068D1905|nr:nidogen-like domain-containing protein [Bryobacter aggregatus]